MSGVERLVLNALGKGADGGDRASIAAVLSGNLPSSGRQVEGTLETIAKHLEELQSAARVQVDALGENTQAVSENSLIQATAGGNSTAGKIARGASSFLGSGLALSPLLSGLIGLFRRGASEPPPPLVPYIRPEGRHIQGTAWQSTGQQIVPVDYGQDGLPRPIQTRGSTYPPQITVQVQAMDSRSFLDRSDDIARAVREAMLNAHSLNDALNEL